jgi:WD40 repeat protein
MKPLLLLIITFLLLGCTPDPTPTGKAFRQSQSSVGSVEAILKLDIGGHTALIKDIIVTKSGDIITASDDKTIRVWDSKTAKEKRKILGQIGAGSEGKIYAMALSPNEKFLAIGGYLENHVIRIYNYNSGELLKVLQSHKDAVSSLAFSLDGKLLISGSGDETAKIWSVSENFREIDTIKTHNKEIYGVKLINNRGKNYAVTVGVDKQVVLYDIEKKTKVKSHTLPFNLMYLAINPKLQEIAVCGEGRQIDIYDYSLNHRKTVKSETKPSGLNYSKDGKFLIAGVGNVPANVNIYRVTENYALHSSFKKHTNLTRAVAFLDSKRVISAGGDNFEIYIWDSDSTRVERKIVSRGEIVWSVGISGENLSWGNRWTKTKGQSKLQKSINLKNLQINNKVNIQSFKKLSTQNTRWSLTHAKGGDYRATDGILHIKKDGVVIAKIVKDYTDGYRHNCYGFYKDYIVSGGANGQLKIYNLQGREVANLVGHTGEVLSIALDGDRLVSGSSDQTIRIWDLSKLGAGTSVPESTRTKVLAPMLNLFVSKDNDWIAWTPEGFYNASKGAEKYIGYHINQGANKEAEFLPIERFKKQFYRPDLIQKAIAGEDISHYAKGIDINALLTAGLPPKVKIKASQPIIHQNSTNIEVEVCEQSGGADNFRFYIDDAPVNLMSKTKAFGQRTQRNNNCTTFSKNISIPSGTHTIGFDATNQEGNIISNTATVTITNKSKPTQKPNLHLLTLSIADYQDDSLDLTYPNNDADKMIAKVKEIGKPIFSNVYTYALKDSQVTLEQIEAKVKEIAPKVGVEDVFVLYISGHGITNEGDGDYYFIPYDAPNDEKVVTQRAISQPTITNLLTKTKTSKSVILLDTCESGSMASEGSLDSSMQRFKENAGRAIIAGATAEQNARDGYKEHGIFTYTLLDAMNNKKVYDFRDRLTVSDIAKYVKHILPKLSQEAFGAEQKPVVYLNGDTTFDIGGL